MTFLESNSRRNKFHKSNLSYRRQIVI